MVIALLRVSQKMTRLSALGLHRVSVSSFSVAQPAKLAGLLRYPLPKLAQPGSFGPIPASSVVGNRVHTLSLSALKSRCCLAKLGSRQQTGLSGLGGSLRLQGRHLSSQGKDGETDTEDSSGDGETEILGQTDAAESREAKLKSAEQFQNMHQLLEDAQVHVPTKDFDFADVPKSVERRRSPKAEQKTAVDPREMTVFLFPGQGTQFVGMGRNLLEYPNVREMFHVASDILGYDLLDLCLNGSQEELGKTVHSQPAILVCSLAAVEKLREEQPKAVENCVSTAGFSVGEISALVFSGALAFEDAIQLIKVRGKSMQEASEQDSGGLLSVIGRPGVSFNLMCRQAMDISLMNGVKEPVCTIAAHLFPEAKVVAGHTQALDYIQDMAKHYSLRMARRVPVSGAFHSPLMSSAKKAYYAAVDGLQAETPAVPVHANVDGKRYRHSRHIRSLLKRQLLEPIHWEQTMHEMYQRDKGTHFPRTYEVGPGQQLGGYLKRNNLKAFRSYSKVDV